MQDTPYLWIMSPAVLAAANVYESVNVLWAQARLSPPRIPLLCGLVAVATVRDLGESS